MSDLEDRQREAMARLRRTTTTSATRTLTVDITNLGDTDLAQLAKVLTWAAGSSRVSTRIARVLANAAGQAAAASRGRQVDSIMAKVEELETAGQDGG